MADEQIVFNVVADYDKAIKEWEQLRDAVATTTKEYTEANQEIEKLRIAKGEFTGVAYKSKRAIEQEKKALRQSNLEYKRREKELNEVFKAQEQNTSSVKKLTKVQLQQKDATGATTSAALELGRVVSDAPYGIRGMANNLTQLVSQMAFATKAAGGFRLALKGLWTSLMGPLGVVLAITAAISALDFFYGANKKAEKSSDEVTDSLEKQRKELEKLTKGYADYLKIREKVFMSTSKDREMLKALVKETLDLTNSDERRNEALNKLVKLYPKYFKGLRVDDIKQLFEAESQVNRILQNKLKLKDALAKAEKLSNEIQLEKIKIGKQGRAADLTRIGELRKEREEVRELIGVYAALDLELKEDEDKKPKKNKKTQIKLIDPTEFDAQSKDLMSKVNSVNQQIELALAESEEDKFNIRFRYQQNALKLEKANYIQSINDKYDKELEKYEELVSSKKMSEEALALWKQNAEDNRDKAIGETVSKYDGLFDLFDKLRKARISAMGGADDESKVKELEGLQFYVDAYKEIMGSVSGFLSAESDRELTIEQNKTNALNAELNDRLLNEKLSADQRKGIQNQIWQNDEALRKRQNEIKKKKFNTEKAFNIAIATADTIAAGVSAAKATYGGPVAKIVAMTSTIGAGLAQVAVIARQKFQPDSASTPINTASGGGGGGVGDRSFDFNLVGNTQENQLANAIQSQFSTPLQAFVVSKDITTQQELDLNIKSSATF